MREVIPGVHQLQSARAGNAYLIEEGDRAVLTDVVLTHYDPDHVGGAAAVQRATGARVWLGAADARILRDEEPAPTRVRRAMYRTGWLGRTELPELTEMPDDAETEIAPAIVAVPAPGHTPGHHLVRWRGVAFIGDAARVSEGRLVHLPGFLISDRTAADATLTAIAASAPRLVCPGHGTPARLVRL